MANSRTIAQVLAEISVLYPLMFQPTPEMTQVLNLYLRDLDDELLINALHHYVATAKDNYPPSVPALRKAASDLKRLAAGVPTAFEAWKEVCNMPADMERYATKEETKEIINRGMPEKTDDGIEISYKIICHWPHPLVEQIARQLGWPKFPTHEEIEIDRAHFFKAYDSAIGKLTDEDRELPEVRAFIEKIKQPALSRAETGTTLLSMSEFPRKLEAKSTGYGKNNL